MYTKIRHIYNRVIKTMTNDKRKAGKIILIIGIIIISLCLNFAQSKNNELVVEEGSEYSENSMESEEQVETSKSTEGYADISGEVNNPGVYAVTASTRLYELIDRAGGVTEDADIDRINQAELVEDGSKIIIPARNESQNADGDYSQSQEEDTSGLININTADLNELMTLNGVGEVIAGRIIEYRNGNTFNSIEDIKNVKGIGEATYDKIKDSICT